MSVEEGKCNGEVKQENLSSSEGLLTYSRRKRMRTGESSYPQEDAGVSADEEVLRWASSYGKGKDFGWEHGNMINGNRYHWKCKWCNFVGRSGGVTRLKKHLAGGWHVTPCKKVPKHISNTMNIHLVELRNKRLFNKRREREQDIDDETHSEYPPIGISVNRDHGQLGMQVTNDTEQSGSAAKILDTDSQQSRDSYPGLNLATQQLNTDMAKVSNSFQYSTRNFRRHTTHNRRLRSSDGWSRIPTELSDSDTAEAVQEPHDTVLSTDNNKHGELTKTDGHWRSVLEHMLQLPDICEGGGFDSSIRKALMCGPHGVADVPKDTAEAKVRHEHQCELPGHPPRIDTYANSFMDASENGTHDQTDAIANKQKCQDLFFDILCSEKFVALCKLLSGNFPGIRVEKLFDLSQINSKMKCGVYGQSPGLFNQDLQQIWRQLQKVSEEMVLLTSSLFNMSQGSPEKQAGEGLVTETCPQKCEVNGQVGIAEKNSNESDTATQFPSCESVPFARPGQTKASGLYKVCICKQCGTEADSQRSLICDECEAVFHFSCVEPAVQEIPTRSWYCNSCTKERTQSSEPPVKNVQQENMHDNCVVCERLEFSETKDHPNESDGTTVANGSRESSVSSMESEDEPAEPSRTALSRLCKQCGTCEDEDKRFLICGHSQCPYKYYHIRCLTTSQIASPQQAGQCCWYCPSCLCRACFRDRDDDLIVLCDNCDEAYHIYCMKPPRNSIPKGQWYCLKCNVAKAKEGMKRYEQWILQQHGKKDVRQSSEARRPMDVLLSAVEKLSSEENFRAGNNEE